MVTRTSYSVRLKWFQNLDWWRASCMLRSMVPRDQEDKSVQRSRPGFVEIAGESRFDEEYSHVPAQPGDKYRFWGVDSFAASP